MLSDQAVSRGGNAQSNVLARLLAKQRTLVMGVVNVTPDSFSDGGRFLDPQAAIAQTRRLAAEGADILDIGAESTRPYGDAVRVSVDEERARLEPVLTEVMALGCPVSVDTMKAPIAAWAVDLGAAETAIGIILDFLAKEGPADKVQLLIAKLPGAEALQQKAAGAGGSGMGGVMGAGMSMMAAGLSMGRVQDVTRQFIAFAREKVGEDAVGEIVAAIPGLSQFV
jgi:Pterin binding enzyme